MNKEDLTLLKKCIKNKKICRIERGRFDPRPMFCVPIKMSQTLLAVHFIDDFLYNGVKFIRVKDITKVKLNEPEKLLQIIFNDLAIPLPQLEFSLEIENYTALFEESAGMLVAIECEALEERNFELGLYFNCRGEYAQFNCVDSSGNWDTFGSLIPLSEITCVTLNSRYQQIFSNYV